MDRSAALVALSIGILWAAANGGQARAGIIVVSATATYQRSPLGLIGGEVTASTAPAASEWRGIAEFDLAALGPIPNASVILNLPDTGGSTLVDATTQVYSFIGDGVAAGNDFFRADQLLFEITRPWLGGTTHHDVTAAVNSVALGGHRYIGFLFVPVFGQDAFGSDPQLSLTFSDTAAGPSSVPEPATLPLVTGGLAAVALMRRRAKWTHGTLYVVGRPQKGRPT